MARDSADPAGNRSRAVREGDRPRADEAIESFGSGWDIYEIAVSDAPHARWKRIREMSPVFDAGEGVFFVSDWNLVNAVLRDPRHGAGAGVSASFGASEGLAFEAMRVWLMSLDGDPHARARGLVRRSFTPRRVDSIRGLIVQSCDACVADIEATPAGECVDLVEKLAFRLPSEVIRSLFGFPREQWSLEVESRLRNDEARAGIELIESLAVFFEDCLKSGRVPAGLLADLRVPDDECGVLSDLEVLANAVLLVTAAIDTTAGLIGNAVLCLLERPELAGRLRVESGLAPRVVEETLRFEPPALSCSRSAGMDFELGGVEIPAGSQLLLGLAAANRDPARYSNPDVFDVDRDHSQLISFGGGRHFCLGAALARLEAQLAIERLFDSADLSLELIEKPVWQKRNPTVRSLASLRVRVGRRQHAGRGAHARRRS
ncbi:MAG: cytochrome P450 [Myxococcota bacterium]